MATIKPQALDQHLRQRDRAARCYLVYGNEPGGVHDHAARIATALAGSDSDDMNMVHLTEEILKEDPGRLADEAQAISMFGGQRIVRLRDPGTTATRILADYAKDPTGDAIIIVEAGALSKSSPLRKAFETSQLCLTVPCYADSIGDLNELVSSVLSSHNLTIDNDARMALVRLLGENRAQSRSEIEKLALYCYGGESVSLEAVQAVCGDTSALSMDSMIDAAFEGDAATSCRNFAGLKDTLGNASPLLSGLARHANLLEALRHEMDGGKSAEAAMKSARPPIFFKRQQSITRQLRLWPASALGRARRLIFDTTLKCRQHQPLESEFTERCLISLARNARATKRG